jgi:hypothetical protein
VRAVVVSPEPALTLMVGARLPRCETHAASSIERVIDLTGDDAVVLLDLGTGEEAADWLIRLRAAGVSAGVVVVDDVPPDVLDDATLHLPRPFTSEQLAQAFVWLQDRPGGNDPPGDNGVETAASARGRADTGGDVGTEQLFAGDPRPDDDVAGGTRPSVRVLDPDEPSEDRDRMSELPDVVSNDEPSESEEREERVPVATEVGTRVEHPDPSEAPEREPPTDLLPDEHLVVDPGWQQEEQSASERRSLRRWLRPTRTAEPSTEAPDPPTPPPSLHDAIHDALSEALHLEELLLAVPIVARPRDCGEVVLQEISTVVPGGAACLLLRERSGELEVIATHGERPSQALTRMPLDHPLLADLVSREGGWRVLGTEAHRSVVAGVPLSHWPVLLAVAVPIGGPVEGLVVCGRPDADDDEAMQRVADIVVESSDLLRLVAALQRLPHHDFDLPDFTRSWQR